MSIYLILAEGSAEKAIIDILLDHNRLIFTRQDILDGQVFLLKNFDIARRFLALEHGTIHTVCIMDSANKAFNKIPVEYREKMTTITDYLTKREIEMLIIINEEHYNEYQKVKSKIKPSNYCSQHFKYSKKYTYWKNYWGDIEQLIAVITEYKQKSNQAEKSIYDLLKN